MSLTLAATPLALALAPPLALPPPAVSAETVLPADFRLETAHATQAPEQGPLATPGAGASEPAAGPYTAARLGGHLSSVPLEAAGLAIGITALGFANWDWGSSDFRFQSEGFFPRDEGSSGMDKLGHAYTTYVMTEFLTSAISRKAGDPRGAPTSAGLIAMGLMTYVEVFDGFSEDHGFSPEDLVMDGVGAGLSILRSNVPALKDTLDFRLQYIPSGNRDGFHPITDYSGQKYLLAFQFAGVDAMRETPLRYVELLGGYYARGITEEERLRGEPRRRELFVGVGLNLQELLFPRPQRKWQRMGRSVLDYVQVPYTAIYSN